MGLGWTSAPSLRALSPAPPQCARPASSGLASCQGPLSLRLGRVARAGESRQVWTHTHRGERSLPRSETPVSSPNLFRHPQRALRQRLCSAPLLPPGSSEGTPRGPMGVGRRPSCGSLGARALPCAPGFAIFQTLLSLPEARYSALHPPLRPPRAPLGPRRLRAQAVASSARTPPSPPLPLTPSPLPPPGPGAARGKGRRGEGGTGEREHRVATPPEPAFSRAAA